jgi:alpha-1,3-glucan synthase
MWFSTALGLLSLAVSVSAAPYNETYAAWNLNTNQNAQSPMDYDTNFIPDSYFPSPDNWRFPFYTILMDKFADGDPSNNDFFGTMYEWDWRETNLRYGGDVKGLQSKLDYLAGMGIKGIFASGTPFINNLWQADSWSFNSVRTFSDLTCITHLGYSALDFTTLDPHWGEMNDWRQLIEDVHSRGMYYMVDFTVGTMGDLIAWKG